jgi:hypothetical protein
MVSGKRECSFERCFNPEHEMLLTVAPWPQLNAGKVNSGLRMDGKSMGDTLISRNPLTCLQFFSP